MEDYYYYGLMIAWWESATVHGSGVDLHWLFSAFQEEQMSLAFPFHVSGHVLFIIRV